MEITNPIAIDSALRSLLRKHQAVLRTTKEDSSGFEVQGTIATTQGRKAVDGFYFASTLPKPKDCRFYFFPIYTDPVVFEDLSPHLRKCLKGKSCFHFKKLSASLLDEIDAMIALGIHTYQEKGRLAPV